MIANGLKPRGATWPIHGLISIVGHVLENGKIDFSACLVLDNKKQYVNKTIPEYNMVNAVQDIYEQWENDPSE